MAAQLRPLKGREVLRKLRKAGFEIVRIKGRLRHVLVEKDFH
jgi:predicted RNA binding protein YcfA (HicA-like mRNA interferase family)